MHNTVIVAIITGLFGLISGAMVVYVGAILKYRKELEAEFDKEIRKERIQVFPELWRHLDVLARYDRPGPLDVERLRDLSIKMRKWYFESGGMFLSDRARESYFDLKERILRLLESTHERGDHASVETEAALIQSASLLRAHLMRDLGTRRSPAVADS